MFDDLLSKKVAPDGIVRPSLTLRVSVDPLWCKVKNVVHSD